MSEAKRKLFGLFRSRSTSEKPPKDSKSVSYRTEACAYASLSLCADYGTCNYSTTETTGTENLDGHLIPIPTLLETAPHQLTPRTRPPRTLEGIQPSAMPLQPPLLNLLS